MAFENLATGMEAYFQHPTDPTKRTNAFEWQEGIPEDWKACVGPVSIDLERIRGKAVGLHVVRLNQHTRPLEALAIVRPASNDSETWVPGSLDITAQYQDDDGLFDASKAIGMISSIADRIVQDDARTDREAAIATTVDWFANAQLLPVEVEAGLAGVLWYELAQAHTGQ